MNPFPTALACALLSVSLAQSAGAAEKRYYRYTNLEGNVVIDDRVPTEYAGQGYEVITEKGVVLDVVPRKMTAEERADREAAREAEREAEVARQQAHERDKNLLLRYSAVSDIEAAKQRSLDEMQIRISILRSNRNSLRQKLENLQAQAADLERRGKKVDLKLVDAMDDLRKELLSTEESIASRERESREMAAQFDSDIARFEELQALVELRRRKERGESP